MSTPPLAFEILSPAMLGWLAAAAAPILLHLWSRRRYRETTWAAMEYLLAALRSSRRRMRLEEWLLLLLRTLVIVLIVVAVAEPVAQLRLVSAPGQRTHRVLVLDGSYSMAYRPGEKTRFDRAKELAARIVEESSEGDAFTLVLLSDPPRIVVGTPAFDARDFLKEIQLLELPHATADLPRTLAAVEQVFIQARRAAPRLAREEIFFLSDLGRVGWSLEHLEAGSLAEFRKRSQRLAEKATFHVIDLGQPDAENVAVTGLRAAESFAVQAKAMEVQAELKNFARQPKERQLVELVADGRTVEQRHVDLQPDGEASVTFSHRFDTPGDHTLEVRAPGDRLDVDNHRWLAVPVKEHVRVLCVDGRPSGDPLRGATGYLAAALAPRGEESGTASVRPVVISESQLVETPLGQYDCVAVADVAQFTSSEARVLDAYVKNGGSVIFFLGPGVQAERYNRELAGETGIRLLPAKLGTVVAMASQAGQPPRLDPLDYRHPIVQPFRGRETAGLLTTPVYRYFQLVLPTDSKAEVVLTAGAHSQPLIVEEPIHRGRVIVVATAANDPEWTAMPVWPSFVPLVQEMLAFAIGGQLHERNHRVGEPLTGSLPASAGPVSLAVQTPGGRSEDIRLQPEGDYQAWNYADTGTSGVYVAKFASPLSRNDVHAVNVDPREGDLTAISPEQVQDDIWPGIPVDRQTNWQNLEHASAGPASRRSELPKMLLYAVLLLLFVETYLARRFGHQER